MVHTIMDQTRKSRTIGKIASNSHVSPLPCCSGGNINHIASLLFNGRDSDTSRVEWRKNGVLLAEETDDYKILTEYQGNMDGNTSLVVTSPLSHSLRGIYSVSIINTNDVIPEGDQIRTFSFQIIVSSESHKWDKWA